MVDNSPNEELHDSTQAGARHEPGLGGVSLMMDDSYLKDVNIAGGKTSLPYSHCCISGLLFIVIIHICTNQLQPRKCKAVTKTVE